MQPTAVQKRSGREVKEQRSVDGPQWPKALTNAHPELTPCAFTATQNSVVPVCATQNSVSSAVVEA